MRRNAILLIGPLVRLVEVAALRTTEATESMLYTRCLDDPGADVSSEP